MWNSLTEVTPRDILDMALVTAAFFAVLAWLKQARAGLAVVGALILGGIYLLAREFRLEMTAWILKGFFAAFILILVIVLQYDLRRLFERLALWSFRRKPKGSIRQVVETLCSATLELAHQRRGALIVLSRRDPVSRYVQGGEQLDGKLSHSLLVSLFDPGSAGHDGAVVIEENRVASFAVHLPLSSNFEQIQRRGTRHSAALGLAELTDALSIVVSEERGEVAIARNGQLRTVSSDPDALRAELLDFLGEGTPRPRRLPRSLFALRRNWAELTFATLLSWALWLVFVSGTQVAQKTFLLPILVDNIPPDYAVETIEPIEIQVTLSGLRRDLYLLDLAEVELRLDAFLVGLGRRTFQVTEDNVHCPAGLTVQDIKPQRVKLRVSRLKKQPARGIVTPLNPSKSQVAFAF